MSGKEESGAGRPTASEEKDGRASKQSQKRGESSAGRKEDVGEGRVGREGKKGIIKGGEEKEQEAAMKVDHQSVIGEKGDRKISRICEKKQMVAQYVREWGQ